MLDNLHKYKILLASKSPRRHELLHQLRIPFSVVSIESHSEVYPDSLPKMDVAQYLSERKAEAYLSLLKPDTMLITADTVVVLGDRIFGKPKDAVEAEEMLASLSGKEHKVVTGVTITTLDRRTSFSVTTSVNFAELSKEDIHYYVETFHPFDKAGAYGIQEWIGCIGVKSISGSYYNVMGLPVQRLYEELKIF